MSQVRDRSRAISPDRLGSGRHAIRGPLDNGPQPPSRWPDAPTADMGRLVLEVTIYSLIVPDEPRDGMSGQKEIKGTSEVCASPTAASRYRLVVRASSRRRSMDLKDMPFPAPLGGVSKTRGPQTRPRLFRQQSRLCDARATASFQDPGSSGLPRRLRRPRRHVSASSTRKIRRIWLKPLPTSA